jgi:hypothetical protein
MNISVSNGVVSSSFKPWRTTWSSTLLEQKSLIWGCRTSESPKSQEHLGCPLDVT